MGAVKEIMMEVGCSRSQLAPGTCAFEKLVLRPLISDTYKPNCPIKVTRYLELSVEITC
jgi:hypothetical protein